jgi:hypothetical protein
MMSLPPATGTFPNAVLMIGARNSSMVTAGAYNITLAATGGGMFALARIQ